MNYYVLDSILEYIDSDSYNSDNISLNIFEITSIEIQNECKLFSDTISLITENKFTEKVKEIARKFVEWVKKGYAHLLAAISKVSNYLVKLNAKIAGTLAGKSILKGDLDKRISLVDYRSLRTDGLPKMPNYSAFRDNCRDLSDTIKHIASKINDISDYINNIKPAPKKAETSSNNDEEIKHVDGEETNDYKADKFFNKDRRHVDIEEAVALLKGPVAFDNSDYDWEDDCKDVLEEATKAYEASKKFYDEWFTKAEKEPADSQQMIVKYCLNLVSCIEYIGVAKSAPEYKDEVLDISPLTKAYNKTISSIGNVRKEYDAESQKYITKDIGVLTKAYTTVFKISMLECMSKFKFANKLSLAIGFLTPVLVALDNKESKEK